MTQPKINKFKKFIAERDRQETNLLLKLHEAMQAAQTAKDSQIESHESFKTIMDLENCLKVSIRIKTGYKDIIKKSTTRRKND